MTLWILVIWINSDAGSHIIGVFEDRFPCNQAREQAKLADGGHGGRYGVQAQCVPVPKYAWDATHQRAESGEGSE